MLSIAGFLGPDWGCVSRIAVERRDQRQESQDEPANGTRGEHDHLFGFPARGMLLTVISLSSLAEAARLRDVTAARRVRDRAHQRGRALGPAHFPLAALGPATFVRVLSGGFIDRSMRADLPPGNQKIVRREPMNAAERLVEHGDHVDDEPDEHGEHAAKHEVGRPAEIEQPQDKTFRTAPVRTTYQMIAGMLVPAAWMRRRRRSTNSPTLRSVALCRVSSPL